jgi:hypothetical protein
MENPVAVKITSPGIFAGYIPPADVPYIPNANPSTALGERQTSTQHPLSWICSEGLKQVREV